MANPRYLTGPLSPCGLILLVRCASVIAIGLLAPRIVERFISPFLAPVEWAYAAYKDNDDSIRAFGHGVALNAAAAWSGWQPLYNLLYLCFLCVAVWGMAPRSADRWRHLARSEA